MVKLQVLQILNLTARAPDISANTAAPTEPPMISRSLLLESVLVDPLALEGVLDWVLDDSVLDD